MYPSRRNGKAKRFGLVSVIAIFSAACFSSPGQARPGCYAIVYWDANFGGERAEVRDDQAFVGAHWNDQISSIRVLEGTWDFYWDANYHGEVLRYGPGSYAFVGQHWNDQISSMRCLSGPAAGGSDVFVESGQSYGWYDNGWNGPGYYVVGFEHRNGRGFGGRDGFHGRHHGGRGGGHEHGGGAHHGGGSHHDGGHHGGGGGGGHHGGGGGGGHRGGGGGGGHHGGGGGGGHRGGGGGGGHHGGGGGGHRGGGGGGGNHRRH